MRPGHVTNAVRDGLIMTKNIHVANNNLQIPPRVIIFNCVDPLLPDDDIDVFCTGISVDETSAGGIGLRHDGAD